MSAVVAGAIVALAAAAPALAVTNAGMEPATSYVAAFAPIFGISGYPHSGVMQIAVNDGTISGTYSGTSVGPDYLNDRILPVSGTISPSDGYVQLFIGGALSLRGTMNADGTISGTASYGGRLYEFVAAPGTLGKRV
ncbi:MAG: hypothetical protein JO146_00345 [Candidatus Eremiobacteraeota bacterium]|nr:hypothetical protein [Candidatus Eremiobacteraeota bacterium]